MDPTCVQLCTWQHCNCRFQPRTGVTVYIPGILSIFNQVFLYQLTTVSICVLSEFFVSCIVCCVLDALWSNKWWRLQCYTATPHCTPAELLARAHWTLTFQLGFAKPLAWTEKGQNSAGMLSPRNGLGLKAKNYGLGLGLVASGLGLGLVQRRCCCLGLDCVASWPHCSVGNIALFSDFSVSSVCRPTSESDMDWIGLDPITVIPCFFSLYNLY